MFFSLIVASFLECGHQLLAEFATTFAFPDQDHQLIVASMHSDLQSIHCVISATNKHLILIVEVILLDETFNLLNGFKIITESEFLSHGIVELIFSCSAVEL